MVWTPRAQARTPMDINQWTKTGGGTVTLDIISYTDEENHKTSGKMLTANPWVGLFVHPSLAIAGSLHVQSPFGNHFIDRPDMLGFTAGVRYYKQLYHFYGYLGAEFGALTFSRTGEDSNQKIHAAGLNVEGNGVMMSVPAGLLLPLTRALAIDLGVRVHAIRLSGGAQWVETSMGYLGVFLSF
jgi:hypothetical protein